MGFDRHSHHWERGDRQSCAANCGQHLALLGGRGRCTFAVIQEAINVLTWGSYLGVLGPPLMEKEQTAIVSVRAASRASWRRSFKSIVIIATRSSSRSRTNTAMLPYR